MSFYGVWTTVYHNHIGLSKLHTLVKLENSFGLCEEDIMEEELIDFWLTVKAATLIFLYLGVVRLFHLLNKGNQVLFIIW